MKIPVETTPALWGAAGGALALAIVGFGWGGWMTGGSAEANAARRVDSAVVSALAPICVVKFRHDAAAPANLEALKKASTWAQGEFIEKGGWATAVESEPAGQMSSVAKACAEILTKA